ncbi:MAG: prepilin-type N-terminal cleavage/methylation domain-containing protein [Cellvibrionaceae bacterium]
MIYSQNSRNLGFTLLEAVVAIAIFAVSASAIFSWVNSNMITLQKVELANKKNAAMLSAIDLVSTMPIAESREGEISVGELRVLWESDKSDYSGDVYDEQYSKTINAAALYDVSVEVFLSANKISSFEIQLLGLNKVRETSDVLF